MIDVKLKVDIDPETADEVTRVNLKETFSYMFEDFKSGRHQALFSINQEEDRKEIKAFLEKLKEVHNWYSSPAEQINVEI